MFYLYLYVHLYDLMHKYMNTTREGTSVIYLKKTTNSKGGTYFNAAVTRSENTACLKQSQVVKK